MENFREFSCGPDPFGRRWQVQFKWLQTAISIRHSNSVDVKFVLRTEGEEAEKTVSLPHPELLALSKRLGTPITDPWCARLAMLHLESLILSCEDMDKNLVTVSAEQMAAYAEAVKSWEQEEVRRRRGAA